MKNRIIIVLSILLLILTAYLCKSWFSQHQAMTVELKNQRNYQKMSDQQAHESAARMREAFKNLDKTR